MSNINIPYSTNYWKENGTRHMSSTCLDIVSVPLRSYVPRRIFSSIS